MCRSRKLSIISMGCLILLAIIASVCGASQEDALQKLKRAREDLGISEAAEQRIVSDIEQLKSSGKMTPETIKKYECYRERIHAIVLENRKMVKDMEAAYRKHFGAVASTGSSFPPDSDSVLNTMIPEEEETDKLAVLDSELQGSLSDFDEELLKKMDDIRRQNAAKIRELSAEAAEAAKQLEGKGMDTDSSSERSDSSEKEQDSETGEEQELEKAQREQGQMDRDASGDEERYGIKFPDNKTTDGESVPSRESRQDDDIVARQLREAAEKETDPELKKKLWKEYEEYKKSSY